MSIPIASTKVISNSCNATMFNSLKYRAARLTQSVPLAQNIVSTPKCCPMTPTLKTSVNASAPLALTQKRWKASSTEAYNTTNIPNFDHYKRKSNETASRNFTYFMIGATGVVAGATAKNFVHDFLSNMAASADVLALAKVEVDLSTIPKGRNVVIKWRGKPIFIRHRTPDEIAEANKVDLSHLRHPEQDAQRVQKPEWLVMIGVCTHLGCVPIGEAGEFGGWYCPCHGSHYDISGRIRKGPAPLNLEIPEYSFLSEDKLIIG